MEEKNFSFEESLQTIQQIVADLQAGKSDFDQQMQKFKEGMQLIQTCQEFLDQQEMRVQQWVEGKWQDLLTENEEE